MKAYIMQVVEELLRPVEGGSDLLAALKTGKATSDQRKEICSLLGSALVDCGLDAEGEPTAKGLMIEAAIDEVNRPNLHLPIPDSSPPTPRG